VFIRVHPWFLDPLPRLRLRAEQRDLGFTFDSPTYREILDDIASA